MPPPTSKNLMSICAAFNSLVKFATIFAASITGLISVICEPMWLWMPTGSRCGEFLACKYIFFAVCRSTPNLFSFSPVEIYGCVLASMSGFTRILMRAGLPSCFAIASKRFISASLSKFIIKISFSSANLSSSSRLPTPLRMIW